MGIDIMRRRHRSSLFVAALGVASFTSPLATAAGAQEPDADRTQIADDWTWRPTPSGWALPISYLGWGSAISFRQDEPIAVIELPDGRGHRLRQVEFTVEVPDFVDDVLLDVRVDGRSIHSERYRPGTTDVVLELTGPSSDLTIEATPTLSGCPVTDQPSIARLRDPVLFYDTDVDATADNDSFVPPDVITQTTFIVEPGRSRYADGAVLDAAAALSLSFPGRQRVAVTSADLAGNDPGPFGLMVDVGEREQAAISALGAGTVRITGRADALVTQARGLAQALTAIGTAPTFTVDHVDPTTTSDRERSVAVGDLPGARLFESGGRQLEVVVPLSQAAFGGPVSSYTARLGGVVSPAEPADLGGSQLSLWLDDELLEIVPVSEQGRFDIERTLGGEQVGRDGSLRLRFDASLEGCGQAELYHLQLDDGSWIKPDPGQGLPPGLDRFPQVAAPGLRVLPGREVWELSLTAEMVTIMQEASTTRLALSVIDAGEVFEQTSALLVTDPDVELQEALGTPTNPRLGRLESGGVTIRSDERLELPMTVQGFVGTDGIDVALIEGRPHGGRGGLPDPIASRGIGLLTGSNVSFGEQHDVLVARVQQTRDSEETTRLLPSTSASENPSASGSARSAFVTGLLLALAGGVLVLATRPLRRRRLNG